MKEAEIKDNGEGRKLRMKGVLFGQAVGDALGLGGRFLTRAEFARHYPHGLKKYSDIAQLDHLRLWRRGDWTDATEQMLCLFDTLYHCGRADPATFARLLLERQATGGFTGLKPVLDHPLFRLSPLEAAEDACLPGGGPLVDNGAIKRTAIIGIWDSDDLGIVKRNAEAACLVTHPRPESVAACIAISCAIAELVQGKPVAEALQTADRESGGVFAPFFGTGIDAPLASYNLDGPDGADAPDKALFAGFHALKHADSFLNGLHSIIAEGGDTAANGAVAGALLGARFGFAGIPGELVRGLIRASELEDRLLDRPPDLSGSGNAEPLEVGEGFARAAAYRYQRWKIRIKAWGAALVKLLSWLSHLPVIALRFGVRGTVWLLSLTTNWITEDTYSVEDPEGRRQVMGFAHGPTRDKAIFALVLGVLIAYGIGYGCFALTEPLSRISFNPLPEIMRVLQRTIEPSAPSKPSTPSELRHPGADGALPTSCGSAPPSVQPLVATCPHCNRPLPIR